MTDPADDPVTLAERVGRATLADFTAARDRIAPHVLRTPLIGLAGTAGGARLKPENLQPLGSFKIRAATNLLLARAPVLAGRAISTASAGNFGQGLALAAARLGIPLTVHAPDTAAATKLARLEALGARVETHPFEAWWAIMGSRDTGRDDGVFIHPVCEPEVILGNGTIGLEILEDWPEVDTIVAPVGGGGLISGIALACRAAGRQVRIVACEIETSTPLAAAMAVGRPVVVEKRPSFVDGIGSTEVLEPMWPLLSRLVDEVVVVSTQQARAAVKTLALGSKLLVEGAGAVAFAAGAAPQLDGRRCAIVLSGGNLDGPVLADILA